MRENTKAEDVLSKVILTFMALMAVAMFAGWALWYCIGVIWFNKPVTTTPNVSGMSRF